MPAFRPVPAGSNEAGETNASLARKYSTSQTTIYHVVHRKTWAHITDTPVRQSPVAGK